VPSCGQGAAHLASPIGEQGLKSVTGPSRSNPGFIAQCANTYDFQVDTQGRLSPPNILPDSTLFFSQLLYGTSLALCIGGSRETEWLLFEPEETVTSNTIQQNEPNQSPFIGDYRIQKQSAFFNRVIPSDSKLLDDAVEEITREIDQIGIWGDVEGISLAVREALANAIIHGNDCDPAKPVFISVAVNESSDLLIIIRDSGSGFDPSGVPDPTVGDSLLASHGRGIFLMQMLMDRVDFRFGQGTEVIMCRKRQWLR